MTTRHLALDLMTRVEGEGAFDITLDGDRVEHAQLRIFEPPRYFEALLRGRSALETPDITARICGICPVAYQTSACNAVETAFGVTLDPMVAALRRLLYCGEWISSHALHIYLLNAPDFLGYPDAITMAAEYRAEVERGLTLKKAGRELMELLGGRSVHPINVRVGGFYRVPSRADLEPWNGWPGSTSPTCTSNTICWPATTWTTTPSRRVISPPPAARVSALTTSPTTSSNPRCRTPRRCRPAWTAGAI